MTTIRARLTFTVVVITAVLAGLALWGGIAVLEDDVVDDAVQVALTEYEGLGTAELADAGIDVEIVDGIIDQFQGIAEVELDESDILPGLSVDESGFVFDALADVANAGLLDDIYDGLADENGLLQTLALDGSVIGINDDLSIVELADIGDFDEDDVVVPQFDLFELQISLFDLVEQSEALDKDQTLGEIAEDRQLVTAVAESAGPDIGVVVDVTDELSAIDSLRTPLWTAAGLIILLAGLATWFLTGRALRPVGAITARVEEISGGTLSQRVPEPDTHDEIGVLAHTMNRMLGRLEDSDRRQRRFVSDASHELRTPVAVLSSEAEVALKAPESTSIEALAGVVQGETGRLGGMIEDLLLLARSDEAESDRPAAAGLTEVDLDDVVFDEAARTRRVPIDRSGVSAARVRGRREDLGRALAHLLDNAARHANTKVAVTTRTEGDAVLVLVDDDGAGVPAAERQRIFERFVRLDDARTRDRGGSGLGLAVVAEIVAAHGGRIEATDSPLGGARFAITLPGDLPSTSM